MNLLAILEALGDVAGAINDVHQFVKNDSDHAMQDLDGWLRLDLPWGR